MTDEELLRVMYFSIREDEEEYEDPPPEARAELLKIGRAIESATKLDIARNILGVKAEDL